MKRKIVALQGEQREHRVRRDPRYYRAWVCRQILTAERVDDDLEIEESGLELNSE